MRTIAFRLAVLVACACACSGTRGSDAVSRPGEPARPAVTATEDASPAAPSQADCEALLAHAADLGARERSTLPPDQQPTEAERQQLHQALAPLLDECRTLSIDAFRCAIEAPTLEELEACQATRTSSTSNSSVAPGGMTPPAPRSP